MKTYIAFLRGINVSGQKKIKMVDLRHSLEKVGLENVRTYIQSGNVIFDAPITEVQQIETLMKDAIQHDFGFKVPVVIKNPDEIQQILDNNPFKGQTNLKGLYFALLYETPIEDLAKSFQQLRFENEDFHYSDGCVYFNRKMGAGKAKLNNNLIENKLKVIATTRNLNTMRKMIELA